MLEKEKLRKADVFTGCLFFFFGLWILSQAIQMPMKDSWGGVQNVWFVSPALFPLLVGGVITLLGGMLTMQAVKITGIQEIVGVLKWFASPGLIEFLKSTTTIRFYAVATMLLSYVFLYIPRIDFFICSVLFLVAFTTMFYLEEELVLKKALSFYLIGALTFIVLFVFNLNTMLEGIFVYSADVLVLLFTIIYITRIITLVSGDSTQKKKLRTCLIVGVVTPFVLGPIFKYFLLVPLPTEGLIVVGMDELWYSLF